MFALEMEETRQKFINAGGQESKPVSLCPLEVLDYRRHLLETFLLLGLDHCKKKLLY